MQIPFKRTPWILFAIAFYISSQGIYELAKVWSNKITLQTTSNYNAHTSLAIWNSLEEFRHQWPERYSLLTTGTQSRLDLLKQLNLGKTELRSISTNLYDIQSSNVTHNALEIGLVSTCITNSPNGFVMAASNINAVHSGLSYLESRDDLTISGVSIINSSTGFEIIVRKLCIVFSAE